MKTDPGGTPDQSHILDHMCENLCSFLRCFLSLREVEKKAFVENGRPTTPGDLRKTVAELIMASRADKKATFDRYGGSSKDRAAENARNNVATERDKAVLRGEACGWCGKNLPRHSRMEGVKSTYCSQKCSEEGRLRRGFSVREEVFALEGGVCQRCGVDAHALFLRIKSLQPAERLSALCDVNWRLPCGGSALDRLLQRPREGDFWQADHIRAVAEGGGQCGADNLQTLCTPCHKAETERLRARLKLNSRAEMEKRENISGKFQGQLDIRSAFGSYQSGSKHKRRQRTAD
mmetsp:Transcript_4115/g.11318  ORF Transcript_4115/g.11318 Transcript_4115/m.11318 type:complete len:291 (+) Transcript_4115:1024-1896(+)